MFDFLVYALAVVGFLVVFGSVLEKLTNRKLR